MGRPYQVFDVFTREPLTGNPLAVVFEADDLDGDRCQAIAKEFNLSETIFLGTPRQGAFHARIFTPAHEMPFAGHPTVGGAIAAAARYDLSELTFELPAGPAVCQISDGAATIVAPKVPECLPGVPSDEALAALLGVETGAIGCGALRPTRATSGPQWTIVPVASLEVLAGLSLDTARLPALGEGFENVYIITKKLDGAFQCRMFAPSAGVPEDPATGSAAVAFTALVVAAEAPGDGAHTLNIVQGVEMGRRSEIVVAADVSGGAITKVRLSGAAVKVAEGTLFA
ncbi:MAG: PhzF family phenazine biosynthesis protein [Pseudomonadota bacterium]